MDSNFVTNAKLFTTIDQAIGCNFEPLPDITAYELAQLLPYFHGKPMYQKDWELLGGAVTRHLKKAAT